MRALIVLGICSLCLSPLQLFAEGDAPPTEAQITAWVKDLGSEDFKTRNDAERNLAKAGEVAKAQIEKARDSKDAEVSSRATRLLGTLKTEPILARMEKVSLAKSVEADMEMSMSMMGQQMDMKGHFKGMPDGKHMAMDIKAHVGGMEMPMHMVVDGTTMWTEMTIPGGQKKMVQKLSMETMQKMGGGGSQSPLESVKQMRENFVFTDVKDGQVDGNDVYILEGHVKEGAADDAAKKAESIGGAMAAQAAKQQLLSIATALMYIDKKDMMVRKVEQQNAQGKTMMSMKLSNVKLDVKLDEKEFSYTPPQDATVMDMDEQLKAARKAGGQ